MYVVPPHMEDVSKVKSKTLNIIFEFIYIYDIIKIKLFYLNFYFYIIWRVLLLFYFFLDIKMTSNILNKDKYYKNTFLDPKNIIVLEK